MPVTNYRSKLLALWLTLLPLMIQSIPKEQFYPYGPQHGDTLMPSNDEGSTEELSFTESFFFYQVAHRKAYVNLNGLISFDSDISYFANQELAELRYPVIAGFYADIDTHVRGEPGKSHGRIYYRVTNNTGTLRRCKQLITTKFSDVNQRNFEVRSALIATWDSVGYYDSKHDKANTFQIVLMQATRQSYVEFLYADDGIQWTKSEGKYPYIPDAPAQVGFANDDGRSFLFKMSGKEQIKDINKDSNMGVLGDYIFRVSGDSILEPKDIKLTSDQLTSVGNLLESTGGNEEFVEGDGEDAEYYDDQEPEYNGGVYDNVEAAPANPNQDGGRGGASVDDVTGQPTNQNRLLPPAPPVPVPVPDSAPSVPKRVVQYNSHHMENEAAAGHVTDPVTDGSSTTTQSANSDHMATVEPLTHQPMIDESSIATTTSLSQETTSSSYDYESTTITAAYPETPPLPFCQDDPYKSSCPVECQLTTVPPGCQRCQCPRETTEMTHALMTTAEAFVFTHTPAPAIPDVGHSRPSAPVGVGGPLTSAGTDQSGTCAQRDPVVCHVNSTCTDYGQGFCCKCNYGFYGNGKECLPDADAQRLNGKVYGKVNGITLPEIDLHTYAVPTDGRAYTALSQMDPAMGLSFLLLSTIGNVMGWLFAKPSSPLAYNGFVLTGGIFNRSVTVHIGDRHTVTIQQEFTGKDIFQYFKVKVFVTGTLPELPPNSTLELREYFEEFNRVSPGIIKSYSTSTITVNADSQQPLHFPLTIDQTLRYTECPFAPQFDRPPTTVLRIERSYVFYDPNEKIVRYASGNIVDAHGGRDDPCREGAHDCNGQHMACARDGPTKYRCLCLDGYELIYANDLDKKGMCLDLNECARNTHRCDSNAMCHNTEGSYTCICNPGFRGTGYKCIKDKTCADLSCHRQADCVTMHSGTLTCLCRPGFTGDGYHCVPEDDDSHTASSTTANEIIGPTCSSHEECHRHGACIYNEALRQYQCQCRRPYSGDGRHCFLEAETCDRANNCDPNADCVYRQTETGGAYKCRCKSGFAGDGYTCTPLRTRTPVEVQCNVLNTCSSNAQCVQSDQGGYVCKCNAGFRGDGYRCEAEADTASRPCTTQDECHPSAHCVNHYNRPTGYICECLPGYKGDGVNFCEPADQCNPGVPTSTCGQYASCTYDDSEHAYVCKCDQGYEGDGLRGCLPSRQHGQQTCRQNPNMCHQRARCIATDQSQTSYRCECQPGYRGDGVGQCEPERVRCNTENICDANAQCITDERGEPQCRCNQGYEGDGLFCKIIQDCLSNINLCDPNAVCVPAENSRYVCRCKSGFHGSGHKCTSDEDLREKSIVFAQGMSLVQRGMHEDDVSKQLIVVPHQIAVGVDFDCRGQRLYWTDVSGHAIRSAERDGSNVTLLFDENLDSPEGVAIDFTSGNVYYTDSELDLIGVLTSDGKYNYPLIKDGLVNPRALAIDFYEKKIYFSDWHREKPLIGRLNLDGTQRENFITDDIALPNSLVVLHRRRELCWADAGKQRLECIGLQGTGSRRVVYAPLGYPFGLTVQNEETFVWTDWEDKKIHSVTVYGSNHRTYQPSLSSSAKLYGITAISNECPQGDSPCSSNNGGCKYICLPDPRGGRTCVCPENSVDPECNVINANRKI